MFIICTKTRNINYHATISTALLLLLFTKGLSSRGLDLAVPLTCITVGWLAWLLVTYHVAAVVDGNITLLKGSPVSGKDTLTQSFQIII